MLGAGSCCATPYPAGVAAGVLASALARAYTPLAAIVTHSLALHHRSHASYSAHTGRRPCAPSLLSLTISKSVHTHTHSHNGYIFWPHFNSSLSQHAVLLLQINTQMPLSTKCHALSPQLLHPTSFASAVYSHARTVIATQNQSGKNLHGVL